MLFFRMMFFEDFLSFTPHEYSGKQTDSAKIRLENIALLSTSREKLTPLLSTGVVLRETFTSAALGVVSIDHVDRTRTIDKHETVGNRR